MSATASLSAPKTILALVLLVAASAFGQHPVKHVIYNFLGGADGADSNGTLVADSAGNLYGAAASYGFNGNVFELSPPTTSDGAWTKTVIYSFQGSPNDGSGAPSALTFDKAGNLYGATGAGGTNYSGTVFELSPPATKGGAWTETVLYNFPPGYTYGKAELPGGQLTFDGAGNIFGTAAGGIGECFKNGCGTVFQLKRPTTVGGAWRGRVIYAFGAFSGDSTLPQAGFVFRSGALYGLAATGGANGQGTLFELSQQDGVWSETILHSFTVAEGSEPTGGLITDPDGNLYGTTFNGGSVGVGAVFELSPPAAIGGQWQETTIYSFTGGDDGAFPQAGVIRDKTGKLFGTTRSGGNGNGRIGAGEGTVFKLIPPSTVGGSWTEKNMHTFHDGGGQPLGKVLLVNGMGIFGTISAGFGAVFNIVVP